MAKHGSLAILLGVGKPDKKGSDSDLVDAVRDFFDAQKDDDAEAGALAFERMVEACEAEKAAGKYGDDEEASEEG